MRLAVLGATGCLGGAVVSRALAAGHDVVPFARSPGAVVEGLASERLDLAHPSSLARALEGFDGVVHAAGTPAYDAPESVLGWLNAAASENAAAAARSAGVRRFVAFGSTDASLSDLARMDWSETRSVEQPVTAFGRIAKVTEECLVGLGTRRFEPVVLRLGQVHGKGAAHLVRRMLDEQRRLGALCIVGRGTEFLPTTARLNAAEAALLALTSEKAAHGIYHVLDRELVGQAMWLSRVAVALGLPDPRRGRSLRVERLVSAMRLGGVGSDEAHRRAVPSTLSTKRTREELGYEPVVSFEDGMRELEEDVAGAGGAAAMAARVKVPDEAAIADLRAAAAG